MLAGRGGARTERRIITTLFCDLVGFTALVERLDPEDVDALLRPYYGLAREVIELYDGVVEKHVGDAVVGVFGAHTVHEDDAERAVRAAVRLQERLPGLRRDGGEPLQARIGVNTGRAAVRLDADPLSGQGFVAGDAVNTAARLQQAAPPGGIVVGETTYALTTHVAVYEPLPPVRLKGREALVRPWLLTGGVARLGVELQRPYAVPFVGREVELGMLNGLFEKSVQSEAMHSVLVVGDAGVGKSRLLVELAMRLDQRSDMLVQWRQVRCSPFDEGSGLLPLAQIVREHAGVGAQDDDAAVDDKLRRVIGEVPDEKWLLQRLRALLGLDAAPASRVENFAAWVRFVRLMASGRPTVLVVEDVHWASDTLLEFLEYLEAALDDEPLLVITSTRPEHLPRLTASQASPPRSEPHPALLDLHPLTPRETERLVRQLIEHGDPELLASVVRSCGGNPLYAEEMARFLVDRLLAPAGAGSALPGDALPASLQLVIAARLETLGDEERSVLADAAVMGTTFWREGVRALGAGADVDEALSRLCERELIRPLGGPVATASEFAFWHTLVRDVAYSILSRPMRAAKHTAVADWLERGQESTPHPALLAHHLTMAFEAAGLAGDTVAAALLDRAIEAHLSAAKHAQPVDMLGAEQHLESAVRLMPPEHPRRAWVVIEQGDVLSHIGRLEEARATIEHGIRAAEESGDRAVVLHGLTRLTRLLNWLGDKHALDVSASVVDLLGQDGPSPELVAALEERAMTCVIAFRTQEAVEAAESALAMAAALGEERSARALLWRGAARCDQGDARGLGDFAEALGDALRRGTGRDLASLYYNYAEALLMFEGTEQSTAMCRAGVDDLVRRGDVNGANGLQGGMCYDLLWAGDWDESRALAHAIQPSLEAAGDLQMVAEVRTLLALLAVLQGDEEGARQHIEQAEAVIKDSFAFGNHAWSCSSFLSTVHQGVGEHELALDELVALEQATRGKRAAIANGLPFALRTLAELDAADVAERLLDGLPARPFDLAVEALWRALAAEREGRFEAAAEAYADAAGRWRGLSFVVEEAGALLGLGRCRRKSSRAEEAYRPLSSARAVFARLCMPAALAETDALLSGEGAPL